VCSLFFYILHIYLIHLLALVATRTCRTELDRKWIITSKVFMGGSLVDFGFELYVVYLVWALVLVGCTPMQMVPPLQEGPSREEAVGIHLDSEARATTCLSGRAWV